MPLLRAGSSTLSPGIRRYEATPVTLEKQYNIVERTINSRRCSYDDVLAYLGHAKMNTMEGIGALL